MGTDINSSCKVHHGRGVRCFREIRKMKQEILAEAIGVSQKTISKLERQEKIDDGTLGKIAKAIGIPADVIKNFDEERLISVISSAFEGEGSMGGVGSIEHNNSALNPLDNVVGLYDKQIELYDQIIKEKDEKYSLLEQLLKDRK